MKKTAFVLCAIMGLVLGMSGVSSAMQLLSQEEALKQMFPDTDTVTPEKMTLTAAQLEKVKSKLGGKLVHFQKGSESGKINESSDIIFYVGKKGGKILRVAVIDVQPGKWGPVEFIMAVNADTGKIQNMAVMSYTEKRGRPIARENFLSQFFGKGATDPITLGKDIRPISGATISSEACCFVAKKAIALFTEAYLPNSKSVTKK